MKICVFLVMRFPFQHIKFQFSYILNHDRQVLQLDRDQICSNNRKPQICGGVALRYMLSIHLDTKTKSRLWLPCSFIEA